MLEPEDEQKISFRSKTSPRVSLWIGFFVLKVFETKIVQSVRFWIQKNVSTFEVKFSQRVNFWNKSVSTWQIFQKNCLKNHVSIPFAPWKPFFCTLFMLFERHHFELKTLQRVGCWSDRNYHVSNPIWKFTTFRTSNQKFSSRHSFCLVEELLQKLQPLCSTYQHVDCLYTLFNIESVENLSPRVEKCLIMCKGVYFN